MSTFDAVRTGTVIISARLLSEDVEQLVLDWIRQEARKRNIPVENAVRAPTISWGCDGTIDVYWEIPE